MPCTIVLEFAQGTCIVRLALLFNSNGAERGIICGVVLVPQPIAVMFIG